MNRDARLLCFDDVELGSGQSGARQRNFPQLELKSLDKEISKKIYVQDRMLDKAVEFYQWLGNGACIYVCGDATNMANDVDIALRSIIQAQGDMSVDEASEYVDELKRNRRYLRDVY